MSNDGVTELIHSLDNLTTSDHVNDPCSETRAAAHDTIAAFRASTLSSKTLAILLSGDQNLMPAAVSGWTTQEHPIGMLPQIPQAAALEQVYRLMRLIDHPLIESDLDRSEPGRYHACHAERQIVAEWFTNNSGTEPIEIAISRPPCLDCWKSLGLLELALGNEIRVFF